MAVLIEHISKSYGEKQVFHDFSAQLEDGGIYCLMGPSGAGKTTLLRILMGLETPSDGRVSFRSAAAEAAKLRASEIQDSKRATAGGPGASEREAPEGRVRIGAVFQEDRLIEFLDAPVNVRLAAGRENACGCSWKEALAALLEMDAWSRPVRELSGGMRRRVAVARALAADSGFLIMDEPFAGLDEETKRRTIQAILRCRMGRTLLIVTHQDEDAKLLGAQKIVLKGQVEVER